MVDNNGDCTASMNDPRLTKWGKWLRRYKLDELPTLWNLLKRDINICGPRPDTIEEIKTLDNKTKKIVLSIRPGIISPATLWNYAEDEVLANKKNPHKYYTQVIKPIKYKLNIWYVSKKSLWFDFKLILAFVFRYFGVPPYKFNIYPKKWKLKN